MLAGSQPPEAISTKLLNYSELKDTPNNNQGNSFPTPKQDSIDTVKENLLKSLPPTAWIIIFNIGFYIYASIICGNYLTISKSALSFLGLSADTIRAGRVWVFLTSMFTHISLVHLISNMLFLGAFGLLYESKIGKINFLLIYLISGFIGGIFSFLLFPDSIHIGSSAAIFGIAGAAIIRQIESFIFGALLVLLLFALMPTNYHGLLAHGTGASIGVIVDQILHWLKSHKEVKKLYDG